MYLLGQVLSGLGLGNSQDYAISLNGYFSAGMLVKLNRDTVIEPGRLFARVSRKGNNYGLTRVRALWNEAVIIRLAAELNSFIVKVNSVSEEACEIENRG